MMFKKKNTFRCFKLQSYNTFAPDGRTINYEKYTTAPMPLFVASSKRLTQFFQN